MGFKRAFRKAKREVIVFPLGVVQDQGAPVAVCSVTLSGDINTLYGQDTPTISGQTYSVTNASNEEYACSSPFESAGVRRPLPATGKRLWIKTSAEISSATDATSYVALGVYGFDSVGNPTVGANFVYSNNNSVTIESGALSFLVESGGSALSSSFYLGISDTGSVFVYKDGQTIIEVGDFTDDAWYTLFAGSETLILLGTLKGGGTEVASFSASGTYTTDLTGTVALVGDEDWCGNTIS